MNGKIKHKCVHVHLYAGLARKLRELTLLAPKPDSWISILGTHMVEKENNFPKLSSDLHRCTVEPPPLNKHTCVFKRNILLSLESVKGTI